MLFRVTAGHYILYLTCLFSANNSVYGSDVVSFCHRPDPLFFGSSVPCGIRIVFPVLQNLVCVHFFCFPPCSLIPNSLPFSGRSAPTVTCVQTLHLSLAPAGPLLFTAEK